MKTTMILSATVLLASVDAINLRHNSRALRKGMTEPSEGNWMTGGATQTTGCVNPPCAASLVGDVAKTTAVGTDAGTGQQFSAGENIYGPFEAGFGTQQNSILQALGCADGNDGHVAGGIDTDTAEQMVAHQCGITLPRFDGSEYVSLLDQCGGHTHDYHFHQRMSCLYTTADGSGHSAKVGEAEDGSGTPIYGKWEDYATQTLPDLDACGGHFGLTPDSPTVEVYHYHVQDKAPFTIGCYGPAKNAETGVEEPVTLATCRALYDECGNGDETTVTTTSGSVAYDPWCPCYDANGSNVPGTSDLGELQTISDEQQNTGTTTTPTTGTGEGPNNGSEDDTGGSTISISGLSTGVIVGIAAAGTAVLLLAMAGLVALCKRK